MALPLRSLLRGVVQERTEAHPGTFIEVAADALTIFAVFSSSMLSFGIGGAPFSDMAMFLVILVRGLQFCGPGLDFGELRRHAFLIVSLTVLTLGGITTGIVVGEPISAETATVAFATLGSVLVVATYIRDDRSIVRLVQAFALGVTVLAASSFLIAARGANGRALGLSTHPNFLGHSCIMGTMAAVFMFERADDRRARLFWAACATLQFGALLRSGSRGGFLGLAVAGFIYVCLAGNRRYVIAAIAATYATVVVLGFGIVKLPPSNPIARFFGNDASTVGSNLEREQRLDEALAQVREHPVFGEGYDGVVAIHVVYLQAWVGAGAIGVFVIGFLGVSFVVWPVAQPRSRLALSCAAAGVGVAWLFTNLLALRDQWLFLAIAMRYSVSPTQALLFRRDDPAELALPPVQPEPTELTT